MNSVVSIFQFVKVRCVGKDIFQTIRAIGPLNDKGFVRLGADGNRRLKDPIACFLDDRPDCGIATLNLFHETGGGQLGGASTKKLGAMLQHRRFADFSEELLLDTGIDIGFSYCVDPKNFHVRPQLIVRKANIACFMI